ncbi:MAG: N-6 DNA methylase [Promethearchaeota archaeon]|nr:MAG: N-6 DNA methylase [Candidatus Lokiarchaeota archaeon]
MKIHKQGTVYTPEIITNYITKITIERFLLEKIKKKFSTKISSLNELFEKYFQKDKNEQAFIDLSIIKYDREQFEYIFEALKSLTVLDPAVGSGHFIIAALNILEKYYFKLRSLGIIKWSNYEIREYIISNNLFGVDIEIKAIDITKRRLFLALKGLASNTSNDKILLNIESNYKVGNAIIGFINKSEVNAPPNADLNDCFYNEIKKVFQTHKDLKKISSSGKENKEMILALKPFHWFHAFPDIMARGGFDIIIENPPYISNKQLSPLEKAIYQKRFETPKGLMNTFGIFIERSIKLCHSSSRISYIVHKNIIRSNNYNLLRKYLLENTTIEEIIDVGAGAFQFVTAETIIIVLTPKAPPKDHKILIKAKLSNQKYFTPQDTIIKHISQNTFLNQENYNINLNLQYEELEIINYIKKNKDCDLAEYFEAKTCIATGNDEKFLANYKVNDSYKKTLRGKNIGRFYIDFDNLYVYYNPKMLHRARDEDIFLKNEKLIMQTISSNLTVAYDNNNYYPLSTCIAIIPKDNRSNRISIKYLLLLMNSKLMNFYYDFVFNLGAHLTTEISVNNINRLPIKLIDNIEIFNTLADFMTRMNISKPLREENEILISYLDDLINLLLFEVIFSNNFQAYNFHTDLSNKVSKHTANIDSDSIEEIKKCVQKIQNDSAINIQIQIINQNPWFNLIGNYFR